MAPVSVSMAFGAFVFGIGMQIAGGGDRRGRDLGRRQGLIPGVLDRSGKQADHADTAGPQLGAQALQGRERGGLGNAVPAIGRPVGERIAREDVDEGRGTVVLIGPAKRHGRAEGLSQPHQTEHVDVQLVAGDGDAVA